MIDESDVKMESVTCALCGSDRFAELVRAPDIKQRGTKEYAVVKCVSCGLAFSNPRPTDESIAKYYSDDDPEKSKRRPAFYEKVYFALFRNIPLPYRGSLLDVGCGAGRYIYTLRQKGWRVKGIDIAYTEYGRDVLGLDIQERAIADRCFGGQEFDAVTFWWTLEHMHDPLFALKEAHRILKKGGVAVVSVHNIDSPKFKIFKRHWFHLFLPKHLYHFSPASLTDMLRKAGFGKVRIRYDLFSFGFLGSIQCMLNEKGLKVSFTNPFFYALSLPLDILLGLCRQSGLITAYAYKQ